ncbi:Hypothetical predicted protein [Paramuricea clavata]|uniref:Uncharacterized protein n=1 Tax=Paramuricea clavata TaxID=317549 RepID=A0A6S7GZH6_PARCT|nr:Hypothetical predicted protein [Paramuricea clavata]
MKHAHHGPEAEPVEEHDSGFVGPMTLLDTFPHNDTFDETHSLSIIASPVNNRGEIYTFMHNRQDYGVLDTQDAKLKAKLRLHTTDITNFTVTINEAEIPPVYHSSQDAYVNLRQILDCHYSEMPFSYDDYVTDYGIIVNDLSPNRNGHSQVLPNSTSGNVGIKLDFRQDTAAAQQLICVGEFRNQLSVGYDMGEINTECSELFENNDGNINDSNEGEENENYCEQQMEEPHPHTPIEIDEEEKAQQQQQHEYEGQKLLDDTTRTPEEAGLIESHNTVLQSVKHKSSLAGTDIINYLRKGDNYRKSLGLNPDESSVDPADAGGSGQTPVPKPGTIASSVSQINKHFKSKGIKSTPEEDVRIGETTINILYDIIMDLTRNFTRTPPNLGANAQRRVLLLLQKTRMPISYIRNKKLKEEYKAVLNGTQTTAPPKSMIPTPPQSKTHSRYTRQKRPYLQSTLV